MLLRCMHPRSLRSQPAKLPNSRPDTEIHKPIGDSKSRRWNMNTRRQVFVSEFSSEFEKILQREIANSDVLGKCRVSGILVARGLVAVLVVACCKALRHA